MALGNTTSAADARGWFYDPFRQIAELHFTGSEYVDAIRGDLNERLARLGLE